MKEGWVYKTVGELFETYAGGTPHKSHAEYYVGGTIPWLKSGEVCKKYITATESYITELGLKNSSAKYYPQNTVVVAMYGATAAQVGILKFETTSNQAVCGLLPNGKFLPEFVYYYFTNIKEDLAAQAQGGAQPNLSQVKIKKVLLPILSLSDQQRIVSYLDAEFAKIEALKANAEKQLQAAKDLFQAALKELLTPKEGWVEKELKTICQVINGRAYKQDEMLQVGKYRLLRVGNFFTNDKWYYSDLELGDDKYCCSGDLLYAWSASFGPRIWDGEKVIYHYHIWKLVCSDCIDKHYLFYWLESDIFKTQVMQDLHGATMNHITKSIMETTIVWFPCLDTQKIITDRLDALSANVKALQTNYTETITLCNDLKQALLKKVFG